MGRQSVTIRSAEVADIDAMRSLEVDAGRRFAAIGLDEIAEDEPGSAEELATHVDNGAAWIAIDDGTDMPVGYALASEVDGEGHLDQVSVGSDAGGRGIGRALIARAMQWAADSGHPAVTLTTFREVEWNGPYYERLGFTWLDRADMGPQLQAMRDEETAAGLDVVPRGAMIREVSPPSAATVPAVEPETEF